MKNYFLSITSMMVLLFSCSKNDVEHNQNTGTIESIPFSEKTLKFTDFNEFRGTICNLILMTPEERSDWYKKQKGFVSQEHAAAMVSEQLSRCETLEQVVELRDRYTQFVFNKDIAAEDFTPYIPTSTIGYSMVCNAFGDVEIGGEIINLNDVKSYDETWEVQVEKQYRSALTKGSDVALNSVHSYTNSRKMWVEAFQIKIYSVQGAYRGTHLVLRLNAQQKVCFPFCVWNTYVNDFYFDFYNHIITGFNAEGQFRTLMLTRQTQTIRGGDSHKFSLGNIPDKNSQKVFAQLQVHTQGVGIKTILTIDDPRTVIWDTRKIHPNW